MKFKEYSFKNLLVEIVDNRGKTCPTAEIGIPLIATNCIKNDALYPVFEKVRYVNQDTYDNWFRGHPEPGDMIFVCKGSPGRVAWVPEPINFCIAQDMVAIRADITKVYPKYLFALLRSKETQKKILNMHVGTLIPHFKKGDFGNLYFDIPEDLEYQKIVGDAYFDFCNKIELNRQTNQTLEQIAQAIFKSWFVDFEPVKAKIAAKQNGQDPELAAMCAISGLSPNGGKTEEQLKELDDAQGSANVAGGTTPGATEAARQQLKTTAALFPDALVESELGEIPEGWEIKSLSKIIEVIGGGTPKRSEDLYWNGDIPWFSVKDTPNISDVFVVDTIEKISDLGLLKSSTKLLTVGTTIITARGTVGKLALVGTSMCMNQSCYGIRGLEGFGPYFNYFNLREAITTLQRNTHGAVFDTITTQTFESYSMPVPTAELIHRFEGLVTPVLKKIEINNREVSILNKVRDVLLPTLLSGELAVDKAA